MSDRCDKCETGFLANDVIAKCVECRRSYHPACSRAGSSQNFTKGKRESWKCDTCNEENVSLSSLHSNEETDMKKYMTELLQALKKDINKNTDEKINKVLESVNCLSVELKNLQCSVTELQNSHQKMEDRCSELEKTNNRLNGEVRDLHLQLQDVEQHSRSANIEIIGLPGTHGEDVYYCLQKIAHAINVPFKREDFSIAHRLRLYSKKHAHPPIIAQFVSRKMREEWLTAARGTKNLNASDIDPALTISPVFINEHLTAHNKAVLGRARRLQREKKISFAGFFNGKILVKAAEGAETERVTALADLDKFDK